VEPVEPESPIAMQVRTKGFGNPPRPFFSPLFFDEAFLKRG
jgi:hypothetical protein